MGTATRVCAVGAVIAAPVLLSGCVSTVSGTAVRAQHAAPIDVQPLTEAKLDDVLLSAGELNGIMGSTQMKVTSELDEMTDHSGEVSDPDCLGAIYGAEDPVYAGSGWTAVRDQVAREPGEDNEHWAEQTAVLYPSAEKAQKFFDESKSSWEKCSGYSVSVNDLDATYLWQIDSVTAEDTLITQLTAQEDADGWACQHALSVVSNVTVEAWACGYTIQDEAATIANDMVANAAKK
jgi:PknH-like extracellular domain